MNTDKFAQQLQAVRRRAAEMQRPTDESPAQQDSLVEALEDFQTTLEELPVAEVELRQQNEELEAARAVAEAERQRYAGLFEFAPDGYLVTDMRGTIQEANRAACNLLKVSQQFLAGKPLDIFFTSEVRQTFLAKLTQLGSGYQVKEWEVLLQPRRNASFDAALTVAADCDQEGKPIALRWLIRDITERKRAEEELQESERRFRQLAENINAVFWMTDASRTQMIYVCPAYAELWGRSCQSLYEQPKSFMDAIVPEDRDRVIAWVGETRTARDIGIEYRIVRPDQSIRWIYDRSFPIRDESGQVYRVCGLAEDITANKQAEESLRQQTKQAHLLSGMCDRIRQSLNLEEILNTTVSEVRQFLACDRVLIFQLQPDSSSIVVVESVAQNWNSMLNMTVQNTSFEQIYLPLFQQGQVSAIENTDTANSDESYLNLIDQVQVKAKLIVPILQQGSEDTSPNLWGLLIAHNSTAPRHWQPSEIELLSSLATQVAIAIQQSLLYQQTQQQAQHEQSLHSFISTIRKNLDLETIFATAAQEIKQLLYVDHVEIYQYLPSRQMWLTVAGYQTRPDNLGMEIPDSDDEISRQLKQFEVVQIDDTKTLQDAASQELTQIYPGAWLLVPLQFQDALWGGLSLMISGRVYHWSEWEVDLVKAIATQLEITIQQGQCSQKLSACNNNLEGQVQARTGELQQTIQGLEQLSILKDDFLSTVSHELRTPLANMKVALEMLEVAFLSEREQRYLEICQKECNREIDLINDLLDLQRLQAESYAIVSTEAINLQDWVPNFVHLFHSRAVERQHSVEVDISPDLPPLISNLKVLERILTELLNNACKYTSAGGKIILRFRHHPDREPPVTIFTISNQAEIPAAELPHIFEKFYRVPNADPWKQGGTGLGLSLVQKLVEHLGGTIQAESGDGWTSFIVELPT